MEPPSLHSRRPSYGLHSRDKNNDVTHLTPASESMTVLLTGSTGNLGTYILDGLVNHPNVVRVYCLNRSPDAETKQLASHEARGLPTKPLLAKAQFFKVNYESENLGLSEANYLELAARVTVIIHNAWPVDFNRRFSSFEPIIKGVDSLIQLARVRPDISSAHIAGELASCAGILFCSSVAAASNYSSNVDASHDAIPETGFTDWELGRNGYGQSKLVSERLLTESAQFWGLLVSIVRIGQLAGPVTHGELGSWPQREWIPSLIKTSVALGAIPADLGPNNEIDWVPVDVAAHILVELASELHSRAIGPQSTDRNADFVHIANPNTTQWHQVLPAIRKYLPCHLRVVSFADWVELLGKALQPSEQGGFQELDHESVPAIKLWDTFSEMRERAVHSSVSSQSRLDTRLSVERSRSLAELQPVNQVWMELWMRQWGFGVN